MASVCASTLACSSSLTLASTPSTIRKGDLPTCVAIASQPAARLPTLSYLASTVGRIREKARQVREQLLRPDEESWKDFDAGRNADAVGVAAAVKARRSTSRREFFDQLLGAVLVAGVSSTIAPESSVAVAVEECSELTTTPSGLAFCDTSVGSGVPASKGLLIKAHYSGKLESGQVFDSSYNRGKPLVFRVGVGEVIKGWDQGIVGTDEIPPMLAGGKRTLRIPPNLAYGDRGAGCRGGSCLIPPNSVLIFDVEFVGKV